MGVVYTITNRVNSKIYVGKTMCGRAKRWKEHIWSHKSGNCTALYRAMRKHGAGNFVMEVVDTALLEEELNDKEIAWIAKLGTLDPRKGYNCTPGGEGAMHGPQSRALLKGVRVVSQKTRAKLAQKVFTPEYREKLAASMRARNAKKTPEERSELAKKAAQKLATKTRGVPRSIEVCAKISVGHKGKKHTPEQIEKQRQSILGRKQSTEEIAHRVESNRRAWAKKTPEDRLDHGRRTSMLRRPWTEEQKAQMAEKHRGRTRSEEAKLNMSLAAQRKWARIKMQSMQAA